MTEAIGLAAALFPGGVALRCSATTPRCSRPASQYLRIVGPFYGFFGLGMALYFASQGAGALNWPLLAGLLAPGDRGRRRLAGAALSPADLPLVFAALGLGLAVFGLMIAVAVRRGAWFKPPGPPMTTRALQARHLPMTEPNPNPAPLLKLLLDLGPLLLFFFANSRPEFFAPVLSRFLPVNMITGEHAGIFVATAVFIPAILAALVIAYVLTRHIAVMPVVTAVIVVVFGGLTLALQNETFIKLKPTLVYLLFAVTLLGGLAFKKPLLGMVFDSCSTSPTKAGASSRCAGACSSW